MKREKTAQAKPVTRRGMLSKLGLVASVAYVAPTLLQLSEARASGSSSRGRWSRGGSYSYGHTRKADRDAV